MPHAFLFEGLTRNIRAPNNIKTPNINPATASSVRNVGSLPVDPGSVGMIPINHYATTAKATELISMRTSAVRDKLKALVGFSFCGLAFFI
jgi:hypothetical protein